MLAFEPSWHFRRWWQKSSWNQLRNPRQCVGSWTLEEKKSRGGVRGGGLPGPWGC
jgi:hypothetical protein